ncbi:MAG: site-specific integrase [Oscillospiraceae bacterium]|nr:site-specific integrase [Oscillospiraceae bacterium]
MKGKDTAQGLARVREGPESGLVVTDALLSRYWESLREKGVREETLLTYQKRLALLWRESGERYVGRDTVKQAVDRLIEGGYANQTVNMMLTAVNGLLNFAQRRELQYTRRLETDTAQPELARGEYLRLLGAAKALGKERTYLLVKTFATLGLDVQLLPALTVEVAHSGVYADGGQIRALPRCLREELLAYAERRGITSGPLFLTEERQPMSRTYITNSVKQLAKTAQVDERKCNPRSLKRLYQTTRENLRADLALLLEQAYERLLEQEQAAIGW